MFYAHQIISKKDSPLRVVWAASHTDRNSKLRRNDVNAVSITSSADSILALQREVPMALRLTGHLVLGLARVHARKVHFLQHDSQQVMAHLRDMYSHSRNQDVDLPSGRATAKVNTITLPAGDTLLAGPATATTTTAPHQASDEAAFADTLQLLLASQPSAPLSDLLAKAPSGDLFLAPGTQPGEVPLEAEMFDAAALSFDLTEEDTQELLGLVVCPGARAGEGGRQGGQGEQQGEETVEAEGAVAGEPSFDTEPAGAAQQAGSDIVTPIVSGAAGEYVFDEQALAYVSPTAVEVAEAGGSRAKKAGSRRALRFCAAGKELGAAADAAQEGGREQQQAEEAAAAAAAPAFEAEEPQQVEQALSAGAGAAAGAEELPAAAAPGSPLAATDAEPVRQQEEQQQDVAAGRKVRTRRVPGPAGAARHKVAVDQGRGGEVLTKVPHEEYRAWLADRSSITGRPIRGSRQVVGQAATTHHPASKAHQGHHKGEAPPGGSPLASLPPHLQACCPDLQQLFSSCLGMGPPVVAKAAEQAAGAGLGRQEGAAAEAAEAEQQLQAGAEAGGVLVEEEAAGQQAAAAGSPELDVFADELLPVPDVGQLVAPEKGQAAPGAMPTAGHSGGGSAQPAAAPVEAAAGAAGLAGYDEVHQAPAADVAGLAEGSHVVPAFEAGDMDITGDMPTPLRSAFGRALAAAGDEAIAVEEEHAAAKRSQRQETGPLADSSMALLQHIESAAREHPEEGEPGQGKGRGRDQRRAAATAAGPDVGFNGLVSGGSRLAAARAFGDLLQLASRGVVGLGQAGAYTELRVVVKPGW